MNLEKCEELLERTLEEVIEFFGSTISVAKQPNT